MHERPLLGVLVLAAWAAAPISASALPFDVTVQTTSLSGAPAALEVLFLDGDVTRNNVATITGFTTDGALGAAQTTGAVAGSLPGTVSIADGGTLGQLLQELTLGTSLTFGLETTTSVAGPTGDRLAFFLLNPSTSFSLVDTNLPADALFTIGVVDGGVELATALLSSPNVGVDVTVVPEPDTLLLMGMGLAAAAGARAARKRSHLPKAAAREPHALQRRLS